MTKFFATADFWRAKFCKPANFFTAQFSALANFGIAQFSGKAMFDNTKFSGMADFGRAQFKAEVQFSEAEFSTKANFYYVQFQKNANFGEANFSGDVNFFNVIFPENTNFKGTQFSGDADFSSTQLSNGAYFTEANFSGHVNFNGAQFSEKTIFFRSKFMGSSSFLGTRYLGKTAIIDVTGFSNMQIKWEYHPKKLLKETNEQNMPQRGLKDHFLYNETFYMALIKNYREMGWFTEADDCYYTYRVEKREHRLNKLLSQDQDGDTNSSTSGSWWSKFMLNLEWLFLDRTFGYGVKPFKLLKTYIFLWLLFIPIYVAFLRLQYQYGKRKWYMELLRKTSRATVHSVDNLTPGINLYAFSTLTPYCFDTTGHKKLFLNIIVRFQQIAGWYLAALFLILFSRVWIR